jgi:phage baseplate assembly protein W
MSGMEIDTGAALEDLPHIRQSVRDILTTPIGSRVMRREYGSHIPSLIDHPANGANRLRLTAATYAALRRWEPRIVLTRVGFEIGTDGAATLDIEAMRADGPSAGQSLELTTRLL